jgi:hypothetical protein
LETVTALETRHSIEVARLRSDNAKIAHETARLAKLNQARQSLREAEMSAHAVDARDPSIDGFISVRDVKNVGNATVRDLFETYLWACNHLDTGTLAKILRLDPVSQRPKLKAFFASLPPDEQAKYGTPEAVFALIYAAQNTPTYYSEFRIVSPEPAASPSSASISTIQVELRYSDGRVRTHSGWYAVPSNNGWKIITGDIWPAFDSFFAEN